MPVMVTKKTSVTLTLLVLTLLASCATERNPAEVFNELAEPFVFDALALTPIAATAAGYHEHVRGGQNGTEANVTALDTLLDDYSPEGIANRIKFYRDFQSKLHQSVDRSRLAGDEWADYAVVDNQLEKALFELEKERSHEHNPALYVELVGNALFVPLALEYAPQEDRYRHIIARLEKLPAFLDQAKKNLQSSPSVWTQVARDENEGNIRLVERVIPAGLPDSLKEQFGKVSGPALAALRDFNTYLTSDLTKRSNHDWRLGSLYDEKLKIWLNTTKSSAEVLKEADAEMAKTYDEIITAARPIHRNIYGNQRAPNDFALMKDVLDVTSDDNRLRRGDQLMDQIRSDVRELREFMTQAALIQLPPRDNLQIIETPEFMRGVYSVAGFMPAPPLQPNLSAYYWVTPIPSDWPAARVNSKLREYNLFKLKLLSIHEVMPGHYVQFEFANEGAPDQPRFRRILRAVFANGPYVEGWAAYATMATVNAGYQASHPEIKLNWLKELLKIQANVILDIRMHTMNMSDDEASELLTRRAFQESEEVRGKILRAKLSSAQLPLYFQGMQQWLQVRNHYQQETTDFSLSSFHDKALRIGPMPLHELGYLVANRRAMSD